jgi:hypothetical protein
MINFIDDNIFIVPYVSYANLLCKKKNILETYIVMSSIFQNETRSKTAYGCGFHLLGLFWAHQFYFLFQVMIGLL